MTTEHQAMIDSLFTRYGSPSKDTEIRITDFLIRPDALDELERVQYYEKSAAETIKRMQYHIELLTAYRLALAERYNYLATSPTVPVVRLIRKRNYYGKVFYYLQTFRRNINDSKEVMDSSKTYPGTERAKAIADYKAYIKSHPGITAEMKIEKSKWER